MSPSRVRRGRLRTDEFKICARVFTLGTDTARLRFEPRCNKRLGLSLNGPPDMSPILPISFLATLLCSYGAVEGALFQQLMFVGAALSATILVCSFEAWSARELPVHCDKEIQGRGRSDT